VYAVGDYVVTSLQYGLWYVSLRSSLTFQVTKLTRTWNALAWCSKRDGFKGIAEKTKY